MSARGIGGGALALALAVVVAGCVAFWPYTIDDTYITARYAEHLAAGHGPVFTPGERVEGYSCPAWVAALAVPALLGLDPVLTAKLLGILAALGIVGLTHLALSARGLDPWLTGAATLWVSAVAGLAVYAPSGMETVPFAFAVLLVGVTPFLEVRGRVRAVLAAGGILLVATLRPEGVLLALAASVTWLATDRRRSMRVAVVAALAVLASLLAARVAYYGSFVPNTFYAKPSPLVAEAAAQGAGGAWHLVRELVAGAGVRELFGAAGGPLILLLALLGLFRYARDARFWPLLAAIGVGWLFVAYAPTDWMPAARFGTPFVPAIVVLTALGAGEVPAARRAVRLALVAGTGVFVAWQVASLGELRASYAAGRVNPALDARAFVPIGEWLARNASPTDRVLAYEVGAVGYVSGSAIVDHEGLVTPEVARIIHDAGGYTAVRFGVAPEALRHVVDVCVEKRPRWFLVRTSRPVRAAPGQPLPPGTANEPIQNALLGALGPSMVLRVSFDLPAPEGVPERYLLLERRR